MRQHVPSSERRCWRSIGVNADVQCPVYVDEDPWLCEEHLEELRSWSREAS